MSRTLGSSRWTQRIGGFRGVQFIVCVAAFAATWLTVYSLGRKPSAGDHPTFAARAQVRLPQAVADRVAGGQRQGRAANRLVAIREVIAAPENLARALARLKGTGAPATAGSRDAGSSASAKPLSENLQVTGEGEGPMAGYRVSIGYSGREAEFSVRLVNALAEQFADDCRDDLQRELQRAVERAHRASETARQELARIKAQFDAFLEKALEEDRMGESPRLSQPVAEKPGRMVENPDWVERSRELEQLQRRRRDLLADRTSLHPEVQMIEIQIERARKELAAIPAQVPAAPTPGEQGAEMPPLPEGSASPLVETFHARKRQLQAAGEKVERLADEERRAAEAALHLPRIETRLAIAAEVVEEQGQGAGAKEGLSHSAYWALGAMLAALAAAAGAGTALHVASVDRPLRTVADVKASLPVPVVAVVKKSIRVSERLAHVARSRPDRQG